jgi:hypothetical protein
LQLSLMMKPNSLTPQFDLSVNARAIAEFQSNALHAVVEQYSRRLSAQGPP